MAAESPPTATSTKGNALPVSSGLSFLLDGTAYLFAANVA
jgi:hypothetical protein